MSKDSLTPYIYTLPRDRAITHAFRVASGLDSMILGEPQILGQMKQAVRQAESAGTLGLVLNRLFQRTFAVAKDVRTRPTSAARRSRWRRPRSSSPSASSRRSRSSACC